MKMKKATAFFLAAGGVLALVGAGCSSNQDQTQTSNTNTDETPTVTTTPTDNTNPTSDQTPQAPSSSTEATVGFTITVNPIAGGAEVSWSVPDSVSKNKEKFWSTNASNVASLMILK